MPQVSPFMLHYAPSEPSYAPSEPIFMPQVNLKIYAPSELQFITKVSPSPSIYRPPF